MIRLKKINYMSQSLWQIGRPDLNVFFFNGLSFFLSFFLFLSSRRVGFESSTALFSMNNVIFGWTRYKTWTQSWKSLLFKVFYCICHIFSCIFWQASSYKKISKAKKLESLNFSESNTHQKTNVRGSFETEKLFLFSRMFIAIFFYYVKHQFLSQIIQQLLCVCKRRKEKDRHCFFLLQQANIFFRPKAIKKLFGCIRKEGSYQTPKSSNCFLAAWSSN